MKLFAFQYYYLSFYIVVVALILFFYSWLSKKKHKQNRAVLKSALEEGMDQPSSMYPIFNHNRCIGCGSCVAACPEHPHHKVLGLINGKSHLITPAECIGHGACKTACPMGAVTLVFGTKERGLDIPKVGENFETDVPGVFIAGELGGVGLIKNAVEKGGLAIENIQKKIAGMNGNSNSNLDVVIVGAGPAGFAASLAAMHKKLNYVAVEQEDCLGGTVACYPKGKLVMTAPVEYAGIGHVDMWETTKEDLIDFWVKTESDSGVKINYRECVEKVEQENYGFVVKTNRAVYKTKTVLLTLGRRGSPRKLGVPGEDLPKVVYRLIDPAEYRGKRVLVVGGGDSALEAAISIAAEPGSEVTVSYRSESFSRAKGKNRKKLEEAEQKGNVKVFLKSNVKRISRDEVEIEHQGRVFTLKNDGIIVCAGGILPTKFLQEIGVTVETKYGTP